ncbi:MAG: hypothetical protein WBA13_15390 [Microcoleaceae cyanobacterium]
MFNSKFSAVSTSALLAMSLAIPVVSPLIIPASPAQAQPFPGALQRDRILAGTVIPIRYDEAEKIVLTPDEQMKLTLQTAQDIRTVNGRVWIPAGSQINGELRPSRGGSQFIADEVIFDTGKRFRLDANSNIITRTQTVRGGASAGDILKGTAVGAAAATALSGILGDKAIATEEVLGGAGLGAIAGVFLGREKVDVIVIRPEEDLFLSLQSDIVFR